MKGVIGISIWNIIIVGIIAVLFVIAYNYVVENYASSLPKA